MNSQPEILSPLTQNDSPATPAENLLTFQHRGNGKIARLPKVVRDQVNQMLLDGVPYADIIQRLGDHGHDLNVAHIGEWKRRGYQDWLLQQEWLDRMTSKTSFSTDILNAPETSGLHEAGLRFAAAQMFDQLMRFNAVLDSTDPTDSPDTSDKFARLVNALSRLNPAALAFTKYTDLRADHEKQLQQLDPNVNPNENQCATLATVFDRIFMMPRPQPAPPAPTQNATPPPTTS